MKAPICHPEERSDEGSAAPQRWRSGAAIGMTAVACALGCKVVIQHADDSARDTTRSVWAQKQIPSARRTAARRRRRRSQRHNPHTAAPCRYRSRMTPPSERFSTSGDPRLRRRSGVLPLPRSRPLRTWWEGREVYPASSRNPTRGVYPRRRVLQDSNLCLRPCASRA